MMENLLSKILASKKEEVDRLRKTGASVLEASKHFSRTCVSMKQSLDEAKPGVITEYKRRSPSAGVLTDQPLEGTVVAYTQAGAAAISVLTDSTWFGGSSADLLMARNQTHLPVLRKEFIVDELQVVESKAIGADAILVIAAAVSVPKASELISRAHQIGLEVLLEVHNQEELESYLGTGPDMIGVNNRDLRTLKTSLETSFQLAGKIPRDITKISESGIEDPRMVAELYGLGYRGFLIGHRFVRSNSPGSEAANFIRQARVKVRTL